MIFPYLLQSLAASLIAGWLGWLAYQCGKRILPRLSQGRSLTRLEQWTFGSGLGFGFLSYLTFALGALCLWHKSVFWVALGFLSAIFIFQRDRARSDLPLKIEAWK